MSTGFVKALGKIGHMMPIYNMCLDANLRFSSVSGGTNCLSVGDVLGIGSITSYIIEWHLGSVSGETVLLSGYNPNDSVDVLHPFIEEPVQGGDLYAVFRYIIIDGVKYSPYFRGGQFSPDLKICFDYIKVHVPPEVECLDGLTVETIYLYNSTDVTLLPSGYTNPCRVGGHTCARALFEIYGNGIYIGDSRLNNTSTPLDGCQTLYDSYICGDYKNYPDDFTAPLTWLESGGSRYARHSKVTLTRQQAIDIADAGSGTTISFSLNPAMTIYTCKCNNTFTPHSDVTWTRITNSDDQILWNSCITGDNVTLIDVCTTGSTSGTTTTTTTLPPTTTTTTTCIGVGCYNIFDEYGGGKILNISGNTALIVLPQQNWGDGSSGFSDWDDAITTVSGLSFSGYTDWRLPSVDEWEIIGFVIGAATQIGWNQYSYYWTSEEFNSTYAYSWRTSDDSGGMYNETYNMKYSILKNESNLYGIAVRTEII